MKTGFYDGVSCVMTGQEARCILAAINVFRARPRSKVEFPEERLVMIGIAESTKSLLGLPTRRPRRFAKLPDIPEIFTSDPYALNIIHYATDDLSTLALQLMQIASHAGPYLHGFQLNTDWPDVGQLRAVKKAFKDARIIMNLAVPMNRLKQAGALSCEAAIAVCNELSSAGYEGLVSDVLVDVSGGKGIPIDAETAREYIRAIRSVVPWLSIGLAGNLGRPEKMGWLAELVKNDRFLNIDAETALRSPDDDLDLNLACSYLRYLNDIFPER